MRIRSFAILPLFLATLALADSTGTYKPAKGDPVSWEINQHHSLIWGGQAYIPIGLRVAGTPDAVAAAVSAGAHDLLVEMPLEADWAPVVATLEGAGTRYLISVASIAPPSKGILVDPQKYRVLGINQPGNVDVPLPDATEAYVVVVTARDGAVQHQELYPVKNGVLSFLARIPEDMAHVVYVYPRTSSLSQIDYWSTFDRHRDQLLIKLKSTPFGAGFRGLVNPLGNAVSLRSDEETVIPDDPMFQLELRNSLEERYRSVSTAMRSWAMGTSSLETFDQIARLVPLWQGTRGTMQFWDPNTSFPIRCTSKNSTAWADIRRVMDAAAARRFDRLVRAIKQVVDVPVVQDWRGWAAPYEVATPALTGVGFRSEGSTPISMVGTGACAASSVSRWQTPGWLIASDISVSGDLTPADAIAQLSTLGARGFYLNMKADPALFGTGDLTMATWSPKPLYFPENALNPAAPIRLAGGRFWLPTPTNGNVIDMGSAFRAYRYEGATGAFFALWTQQGTGRVKLRFADPKNVLFETLDGQDPKPKYGKNSIEVTLSPMPIIITGTLEVPVPEIAMADTVGRFDQLIKIGEALNRDVIQEKYTFKDAASGFERNPGPSFGVMRAQYWRLTAKLAPFLWVEGEGTRNHTMSDSITVSGCAGNAALMLRSLKGGDYKAEYPLPVRTEEDITVWIAGRIPESERDDITLTVNGQALKITEEAGITYGQNIAWYKMGVTQLRGTSAKMTLSISGDHPHDLLIDAYLLAPADYTPVGAYPPELRLAKR